ncbi:MAG: GNAT family N-acetyltransferase [Deltaproteobacteria bacterium HGW-Deltaproteobacteria-14]|jgi:GNAT superfamily N-acetyltransferase|nr:MAG: GNAT family N-acetyltransferase [Deltaproteobacteria bacterium HGW-Deltaproteobacteria-14]
MNRTDDDEVLTLRWVAPDDVDPDYAGERDLRWRVLRVPLGMGRGTEVNAAEERCLHLVARDGERRVVGCVIFRVDPGATGQLMQMAVEPALQGQGVGRVLVAELERRVRADGVGEITLHAREVAVGFYERLGYAVYGDPFTEVSIPHRHMRKVLEARPA